MNFELDLAFFDSVTVIQEWSMFQHKETLTDDEVIKVLKGEDRCRSTTSDDHPEFSKLRTQLGELGYISIQKGWWNGDRVLKSFTLNGAKFSKNEKFPCAYPCGNTVKYKLKKQMENSMKRSGKR